MPIKRRPKSEEQKIRERQDRDRMSAVCFEIWKERDHVSQISGKWLGDEPYSIFFEHLLEKAAYPQFKFEKENIILITPEEHDQRTKGHPSELHKELIEQAKQKFLYAK